MKDYTVEKVELFINGKKVDGVVSALDILGLAKPKAPDNAVISNADELESFLWRLTFPRHFGGMRVNHIIRHDSSASIILMMDVPDARETGSIVDVHCAVNVVFPIAQSELVARLRISALDGLKHEFDEWFKVDGVQVNDPHPVKNLPEAIARAISSLIENDNASPVDLRINANGDIELAGANHG